MWDLRTIVERMQLLAAQREFAALSQLCTSPEVRTIAKVAQMMAWGTTDGVEQLLAEITPRPVEEKTLAETEIDPSIVNDLAAKGVSTIGDFLARKPEELKQLCHRIGNRQIDSVQTVIDWHRKQHDRVERWPYRVEMQRRRYLKGQPK